MYANPYLSMTHQMKVVRNLFEKHVEGTAEKAIVADVTVSICRLTNTVNRQVNIISDCDGRVYMHSRSLKHLYDRKPAEEFHFLVDHIHKIVKYPEKIFKNKNPKRGDICFTKSIDGENYFCSLEFVDRDGDGPRELCVVTAFRLRKDAYLRSYDLLWSWRDGTLSS